MEVNLEYRGIGKTVRILLIASAAFLVSAQGTGGSKTEKRFALCSDELKAEYGAVEFSDTSYAKSGRSVYTTARRADGETIRFRCLIRREAVRAVEFYVPDDLATAGTGSRWISAEPYRVKPEPDADVPAETTLEQEPKKSEVPEEVSPEFKTPGTGTGFKTPGARTGSQFKPAK
jgi:hypothetical protein